MNVLVRMAACVLPAVALGVMVVSCSNNQDGNEVEHIFNFGKGDLSRTIPAEGGSVVLFDGNDGAAGKYYDWCYAIDLPLDVIDSSEDGNFAFMSKVLSGDNKWLQRTQFDLYRYGNYIDSGMLPDPGCNLYFFKDAYTPKGQSNYPWMSYLALYTDEDLSHFVEVPGWGELRFYNDGRAVMTALPNTTGEDRYLSLIYDWILPGTIVMSGSVEIRQPAMTAQ